MNLTRRQVLTAMFASAAIAAAPEAARRSARVLQPGEIYIKSLGRTFKMVEWREEDFYDGVCATARYR